MQQLTKPSKLNRGDTVATISPCWGIAGEKDVLWKYQIGKQRLEEMGLKVIAAPYSLRGEKYLESNPEARAEDIIWAFENAGIKAIIANIGGNDSEKVLPFLTSKVIQDHPKILIGYSDVMNYHLFCYKAGLSTFYGPNLLPIIAETPNFHSYSRYWFQKVLFHNAPIGEIRPADTYSCDQNHYIDRNYTKAYHEGTGYLLIQGKGTVQGRLFGGHLGLKDFAGLTGNDFVDKILFVEDIPECFTPQHLAGYVDWLGNIGALQKLKGLIIGKLSEYKSFQEHKKALLRIVNSKYDLCNLPIMANVNFGHTSPICILPYGALAELDCDRNSFSIIDSGVL